jgi:hypothetical protein
MTEKLSTRLFYGLVLSIIVLMIGFGAVGIRAFASAMISDSIYLGAFGVLLMIVPIYFVLHRPPAATAMDLRIRQLLVARSGQVRGLTVPSRHDRRRPLARGQARVAVAHERRSTQLGGFRMKSLEPVAAETLPG